MTTQSELKPGVPERVAVFIDYMNAYKGSRQAAGADRSSPGTVGQFDPWSLAKLLAARREERLGRSQLIIRAGVYLGMPAPWRDRIKASGASRQVSRWKSAAAKAGVPLRVETRPLYYRQGKAHEKGIDEMLCVDLAVGACLGEFDAAVVFSGDTDVLPAVERARDFGVACDSASWTGGARRLQPPYVEHEYRLSREDYRRVSDPFDYSQRLRPR